MKAKREKEGSSGKVDLGDVKHKILILSGKGGVGKSTVAANVALSLAAEENHRVGLMDADLHGPNIPKILGLEKSHLSSREGKVEPVVLDNLKVTSIQFTLPEEDSPVIWRGPLKMKAIRQFLEDVNWGRLDYLVVDLPPGTGDEALSVGQLISGIDGTVIVTTPQELALLDVKKTANFTKELEVPLIGIIENMSGFICPHCGERTDLFKAGGGEKVAEELAVPFLGSIPLDARIVENEDRGTNFLEEYGDSAAARSFREISRKIEEIVD